MPDATIDPAALERSLALTREGLAEANYALHATHEGGGVLRLRVSALEDACEECLVPKAIFVDILRAQLLEGGVDPTRIEVDYPIDGSS